LKLFLVCYNDPYNYGNWWIEKIFLSESEAKDYIEDQDSDIAEDLVIDEREIDQWVK
jgi:hypothetical protein